MLIGMPQMIILSTTVVFEFGSFLYQEHQVHHPASSLALMPSRLRDSVTSANQAYPEIYCNLNV